MNLASIYCPYTNKDLQPSEVNREHIIPLSLGGINGFEIFVCEKTNSILGIEIDGKLAKDPFILKKRELYNSSGHSGKKPQLQLKSKDTYTKKPLRITFDKHNRLNIYCPTLRKSYDGNKTDIAVSIISITQKEQASEKLKSIETDNKNSIAYILANLNNIWLLCFFDENRELICLSLEKIDPLKSVFLILNNKESPDQLTEQDKEIIKKDLLYFLGPPDEIQLSFFINIDLRRKFVAKVALAAGYYIYQDLFRNHVKHNELRTIMNTDLTHIKNDIYNMTTLANDGLLSQENESDLIKIFKLICKDVGGSSIVGFVPSRERLAIFVGILGEYIGMLDVPIKTDSFNDYSDGHVVCIQNSKLIRTSFISILEKLSLVLSKNYS